MTEPPENQASPSAHRWLALVRFASLLSLVTSAMLFVDYTAPEPAYCDAASGCAAVRASGYGMIGGVVPVPLLGLVGFGLLLLLSLVPQQRARVLMLAYSVPIALASLVFLGLQFFVIHHFCVFCLVVDVAGVVTLLASYFLHRAEAGFGVTPEARPTYRYVLVGLLAVAAPLIYPHVRASTALPPALRAHYVAGKLNVVEFADFECAYCRRLHPILSELVAARGDDVNFVRLNHPLPFHHDADLAARAFICADEAGHGDSMADRLFDAESLAPAHVLELAQQEGLDLASFGDCLTSEPTSTRLAQESALFTEVQLRGLPSTFIGDELVVGAQPRDVLEEAFERAAVGAKKPSVGPFVFSGMALAMAGLLLWLPRRKRTA